MQITNGKWMSKEEAGVHLGTIERPLSARRVLELAREGRLDSAKVRDPNSGQTVVRISAESIDAYLEKKKNPAPVPEPIECEVREPQASHTTRLTRRATGDILSLLAYSRAEGDTVRTPLFLTLDQAVDYSGLPAAILVQFVTAGKLPAMDVGRRRGGRWRIRRVDLERIEAQAVRAQDPDASTSCH